MDLGYTGKNLLAAAFSLGAWAIAAPADATVVTVVGDLQTELGCASDFDPGCAASNLALGADARVWRRTFTLPAGAFSYLVTLDGTFDVAYGAGGVAGRPGAPAPQIPLSLGAATPVRFYFDPVTHWVTDNVNSVIASLAGDFQSELGCTSDFDPACLRSWLQDPDGNGVYEFAAQLPAGDYSFVVALNESFVDNGKQYSFATDGTRPTRVSYDPRTGQVTIAGNATTPVPLPATLPLMLAGLAGLGWTRRRRAGH